jgi:hypothetical protein
VLSSFFVVNIFLLPSFILLIISCVIHYFLALSSTFQTKSLPVSSTHFLMLFHCTSTLPLSHWTAQTFSSRASCTFCRWACKFCKSHQINNLSSLNSTAIIASFRAVVIMSTAELQYFSRHKSRTYNFPYLLLRIKHDQVPPLSCTSSCWCNDKKLIKYFYYVYT